MNDAEALTEQEIEEIRRQKGKELRNLPERAPQWPATLSLPAGINRALTWIGFVLAGMLGLFLVVQAAAAVSNIGALPSPFDWIVGLPALVFAGMLTWVLGQLVLAVFRLRRNPSVNLPTIQTLIERSELRNLAQAHANQAVRELRTYLEEYQFSGEDCRTLAAFGLTDRELEDLKAARQSLLANDGRTPPDASGEWISAFQGQFQSILDGLARRRVARYAWRAGFGTAVGRGAVIDQAVVLYACVTLIRDLTFIYRLRPAPGQTAAIFALSITQVYLAGVTEQAADAAADTMSELATEGLRVVPGAVRMAAQGLGVVVPGANILGRAVASLVGMVAEGAVQGFLVRRLGRRAISLLQPVQPPK